MNVSEFVSETLIQVMEGVRTAQDAAEERGAIIHPSRKTSSGGRHKIENIEFDIAITVSDEGGASGGIRIAGVGAKGDFAHKFESVSRVRFTVPVILPRDRIVKESFVD